MHFKEGKTDLKQRLNLLKTEDFKEGTTAFFRKKKEFTENKIRENQIGSSF
jgi:hypothetical protein